MNENPQQQTNALDADAQSEIDQAKAMVAALPVVKTWMVLAVIAVVLAVLSLLFAQGYLNQLDLKKKARDNATRAKESVTVVTVMRPTRQSGTSDLILPGNAVGWQSTLIYPRTNGYLKELRVDIGDRVEAGQLLAVIDTPETDAQLTQARATVLLAKANIEKSTTDLNFSRDTLTRIEGYNKSGGVTQQQLDQTRNQFNSAKATLDVTNANLAVAEANVVQLEALQGFEKVVAPFSGTIITRNYDLGALLSAAPTASVREMFRIDRTDTIRVFVDCPQANAPQVKIGQDAEFLVRDYPGRIFAGKVTRSADAVDPVTRTQRFQVDIPNGDNTLRAGMYGQIRFRLVQPQPPLVISSSALVYNAEGLRVAVVRDGKTHLLPVTTGRDFGAVIEITQGLDERDEVVTNPGQRMVEGTTVRVNTPLKQNEANTKSMQEASSK